MRLSIRFVLPLLFALALAAYGVIPLVDSLTVKWFTRDLEIRTKLITNTVQDSLISMIRDGEKRKISKLFNSMVKDERLFGVGLCGPNFEFIFKTDTFPEKLTCMEFHARTAEGESNRIIPLPQGPLHYSFVPLEDEGITFGYLALLHDISFIQRRSGDTKRYIFYLFIILGAVVSVITVLIAQLSWRGWMEGIRSLIKGEGIIPASFRIPIPELRPIEKDLRALIRDLETDRKTRDEGDLIWTPKTLKEILQKELVGDEILIVSNRQPYIHTKREGKIETQVPASGLVTALEPIMRACSGTWIAHGNGNADREVVDKFDHVKVPPENPSYQIRRVWLSKEEEMGYYYGFSNEGLWPLCHIAHTRPIFRGEDWKFYQAVNEKFAASVVQESKSEDPVILVQDYHFALLPRLIKNHLPRATIITFWHIPWPNPEAFGICPWRNEILDGLLGSSILGFHTRFHCNNFIDTVDRFIECRIDRDIPTISYGGKLTAINNYPISIEWPLRFVDHQKSIAECRTHILRMNGIHPSSKVGIGVDRLDYTKGILERFLSIERFLELYPQWIGKFIFIQIAAPSRSIIDQYQHFEAQVRDLARKINSRFGRDGNIPIHLKVEHHDPHQVYEYYRGADICFVSSLHDGMNLVAKEFLAARDDERGVLILSQFTGAARELAQALIVNPYNIDQCATALQVALEMPESEQRDRMRTMRGLIKEFNVFRWAGRMLMDASRIRQHNKFFGKFPSSPVKFFPPIVK